MRYLALGIAVVFLVSLALALAVARPHILSQGLETPL